MLNTVLFDLDGTLVQHGHVLLPALLTTWQEDRDLFQIKQAFAHQILWFYDHVIDAERQGWMEDLWQRFYGRILGDLHVPDADGSRAQHVYHFFADHPVPPLFDDVLPVVPICAGTDGNWASSPSGIGSGRTAFCAPTACGTPSRWSWPGTTDWVANPTLVLF